MFLKCVIVDVILLLIDAYFYPTAEFFNFEDTLMHARLSFMLEIHIFGLLVFEIVPHQSPNFWALVSVGCCSGIGSGELLLR
eukprot:c41372_g1_i1 orf=98-343(-)